jgi:hypothetical protein
MEEIRRNNNPQAVIELAKLTGATQMELQELEQVMTQAPNTQQVQQTQQAQQQAAPNQKISLQQLDPEIQSFLRNAMVNTTRQNQETAFGIVDKAVDTDPTLSIIKSVQGGDLKMQAVKDIVKKEVQRRVVMGEQFSPTLISSVIQAERARMAALGVGTGQAPEQSTLFAQGGLGPMAVSPSTLQAQEPPKRVPVGAPGRAQYMRDKIVWEAMHSS